MDMDTDQTIVDLYETAEYEELVRKIRSWYRNGYIVPDSLTSGITGLDSARAGQTISMINLTDADFAGNQERSTGKQYESIPFGDLAVSSSQLELYGMGITTASRNPEKVCEFLNLLYTDQELSNLINYGIEGKHYVHKSEHIITFPEGVSASNLGYGNQVCSFGDPMLNYRREPFTEDYYTTLHDYALDQCTVSKAFGYTFDFSSVREQVAEVNTVIDDYGPAFSCGMVDIDFKLPEFIRALKTAGIDKVIAENQKQLDAWLGGR